MFEPIKKIALLCLLSIGFALSQASFAIAAIDITPESAAEFARRHKQDDLANILESMTDENNENTILCGKQRCSKDTQICLKCTVTKEEGMSSKGTEVGRCISKTAELSNKTGIIYQKNWPGGRNFWPADDECPEDDSYNDSYGMGWGTSIRISIETSDWFEAEVSNNFVTGTTRKTEFEGIDGKKYQLIEHKGATIEYANSKEYKGCEVLPVKIYNMKGCFFCPLASLVLRAANTVTEHSFNVFGSEFKTLIVIAFAIWLAFAVLGQIFALTKQDAPKLLAAILKQGFKIMIAFFLLTYSADLFANFVSPLLKGGLDMGMGIQTVGKRTVNGKEENDHKVLSDKEVEDSIEKLKIKEVSVSNNYFNIGTTDTNDPKYNRDTLYFKMKVYLVTLQSNLSVMEAIGTTLFCVGSHKMTFWSVINGDFKKGLRMMFLGGILTVFAFLLGMAFAFYFIDALLQLSVIGAMMPLMIAGWPFKPTAQYASTGFKMLLNTFFVMFFTGFVVSVDIELVNQSLGTSTQMVQQDNKKSDKSFDIAEEESSGGFNKIIAAANEQNWEKMDQATDIGGAGFLIVIFCCIFGFKFVAQVSPLASKLSAGGFSKGGIASKIATSGASATKGMAMKALQPVGQALAEQYHDAGGVVGIVGDSAKTVGTVAGAIGGAAKEAGNNMAAKGGRFGRIAGKTLSGLGSATSGVGKAVGATGGTVSKVSKKVHQAYQKKEK